MKISEIDTKIAYRKLKAHVYYDNSDLLIRGKIAEFECSKDFDKNITKLTAEINKILNGQESKYLNELIDEIDFYLFPKKVGKEADLLDDSVITNSATKDKYNLDKVNFFIKASIELHILSMLWIVKSGYVLSSNYSSSSYAYKFDISDDFVTNIKLFKPYFKQYREWRDNGLKKAKQLLSKSNNIAILTLDVKNFYHSVNLPFDKLKKEMISLGTAEYLPLTQLIKKICDKYTELIFKQPKKHPILPIGILFSGILANWYLQKFDNQVVKKLNPIYYGRYVDDILIVQSLTTDKKYLTAEEYINEFFIKKTRILAIDKSKNEVYYKIDGYNNLGIQKSKVKLLLFAAGESSAVLENFEKNIRESSSEFRFLPEEEKINTDFNDEVYSLIYSDSVNKLRSVVGFRADKFCVSKYLAGQIYFSRMLDVKSGDKKKVVKQLQEFISGERILDYFQLWEKVFTCLFFYGSDKEHIRLCSKIGKVISRINIIDDYIDGWSHKALIKKIQETLIEYLKLSIAMPFSLNKASYYRISQLKSIKRLNNIFGENIVAKSILDNLRRTNMFRHEYVFTPLLNYTKAIYDETCDLSDKNYRNIEELLPYKDKVISFSPRFVNYDEATMFSVKQALNKLDVNGENDFRTEFNSYLNKAFDAYYWINYKDKHNRVFDKIMQENLYKIDIKDQGNLKFNNFIFDSTPNREKLRIALANIVVQEKNVKASLNKKPHLSSHRMNELFKILNMVEKERADLLVMPELSVPYDWLPILSNYSRRHQKALIFGLEHFVTRGNYAINALVTILPFKSNGYKFSFVKLRIKNHYSPEEELEIITQHKCKVPMGFPYSYDIFVWNGIHFSCFNCYELADIKHRSIFRSKIDIFFASEFNADVNYFSNIVESVSRDIHCYFVQVNSANYGDSRITAPSKTEIKNIIQIKGGDNSTILIGQVDVGELRKFQIKNYNEQKNNATKYEFKPTPPDFDKEEVRNRMTMQ